MSESDNRFDPPAPPSGPLTTPPADPQAEQDRFAPPTPYAAPSTHEPRHTHEPPQAYEAPHAYVSPAAAEPPPVHDSYVTAEPAHALAGAGSLSDVPPAETAPLANRIADELIAWLKTLASAAVYATLIVTFGFQVARVEGQSMAPTLQDQDRLIVNKLAYRIGEPQIGDIVMLYYPNNPEKSFVKRVIAAEGDQVKIVDGKVYRNEVLMDDSFVPDEYKSHDDWGPEVVPEGYYFVMGDHRNNSSDSRHWRWVPKKYIIGRVQLRWWPLPEARTF